MFQKQLDKQLPASEPVRTLDGKRILAVDDITVNLDILSAYIKSWGCDLATAANGDDALTILRAAARKDQGFDLAIIDHMMPGMNGDALARAIKSDPALKDVKMIKLSSAGMRSDIKGARELGFHAELTKPIRRIHLFKRVSALLCENQIENAQLPHHHHSATANFDEIKKRNVRVLVVEDNTTNQKVARHMLTKMGCRTDVAGDGQEAVQAVQQIPYDLVLMDVQMPVMDGLAATRKIRELEAILPRGTAAPSPHTPIVALTANVMMGDREKCLAAGMDDFLAKPINPDGVRQIIDEWVLKAPMDAPINTSESRTPI